MGKLHKDDEAEELSHNTELIFYFTEYTRVFSQPGYYNLLKIQKTD